MAPTGDEPQQGSRCTTTTLVTIREGECLSSKILGHFNRGTQLEVLQVADAKPGELLRAEVRSAKSRGWITMRNTLGKRLVGPEVAKVTPGSLADVIPGSSLETLRLMPLRAGEALSSEYLGELPAHTRITVLEIVEPNSFPKRAKVTTLENEGKKSVGWASLSDSKGNILVRIAGRSKRPKAKDVDAEGEAFQKKQATLAKSLLISARSGDFETFQKLAEAIREGDDSPARRRDSVLDCCDARGRTPLIYAAAFGSLSIVKFLLSKDEVYVNAMDDTQKTALHHAARHSQAEILRYLLNAGAMSEARDHNGCTALMFAAGTGNASGVQVLLEKQANPNAEDHQGNSALSYAKDLNHKEVVAKLIAAGAVDLEEPESSVQKSRKRRVRTETVAQADLEEAAAVAVQVIEPGLSSEEQRLRAAEERLRDQLGGTLRDLEASLEAALQAGVKNEELMSSAAKRIEELQERDTALDHLLAAIDELQQHGKPMGTQGLASLEEALQKAKEKGVLEKDIQQGQKVYEEELPRAKARQQLKDAQETDSSTLRDAIEVARKAQLPEAEMVPFEELLRGAESKEAAEGALKKAIESKDVSTLKFALQQAKEAQVDPQVITKGEEVLKAEAPKHEARQLLAAQLAKVHSAADVGPSLDDLTVLQEAIERAKSVELPETEYARALDILALEKKRATCKAKVEKVLTAVKEVDKTSLESVETAKDQLSAALQAAKASEVPSMALREADAFRRRLHNMVEDLKGSIRVFCRIRPLSQREKDLKDTDVSQQVDMMTVNVQKPSTGSIANDAEQFNFDAVFKPGTQAEVFDTCKDLVQSALDGYNVTMFAYGQTGAGKTFTMYGGAGNQGTAPRTIEELYRLMKQEEERVRFTVMASMMELYRNELVDLLAQKSTASPKRKSQSPGTEQKLNVRVDKNGAVQIEHLYEEECKTAQALSELLERGNQMRTVCATKMNSESSRSHLILTIRVVGVNKQTEQKLCGKILLCDLAGSERLKKSDVSGEAQKEAIEINKSLTALGDVMEALVKGNQHVPYKNHKLTQVMSDALGGTSKTLMFVNCSPASSNFEETLMTLKFASRAKTITNDVKRRMIAKAKPMPKA